MQAQSALSSQFFKGQDIKTLRALPSNSRDTLEQRCAYSGDTRKREKAPDLQSCRGLIFVHGLSFPRVRTRILSKFVNCLQALLLHFKHLCDSSTYTATYTLRNEHKTL